MTVAGADPATPAATPAPATAATEPQLAIGAGPVNDLDELTVQGTGFPPGAEVVLAQCTDGAAVGTAMIEACDLPDSVIADAGPDGTFAAQFTIRSVIAFGTRREVVCPDSTCAMGAADATDTVLTLTPLTWSADAAVPPAPQLTIAELTLDPDKNTGTAVLTGSGYTPGSRVALAQCPATPAADGVDAGDCLYNEGTIAFADERGDLQTEMAVYPRFQRSSDELIDCTAQPTVCTVADPWPEDNQNRISVATFASVAP